jgi:putative hydrolase of the HAD superfamily
MTPQKIKALVVDLDGVLRTWQRRPMSRVEADHGLPAGAIASVAFDPLRLLPAITGASSDEEWRAQISAELAARYGRKGVRAVEDWSQDRGEIDQEVLDLVTRQRELRRVAVLTNATSRLRSDLAEHALDATVDAVFSSAELGVAKPDSRAFELAASALGCTPPECAFVDDSPDNVAAAAQLGMTTHLYRTVAGMKDFLDGLDP